MPLFIDVHEHVPGLTKEAVAGKTELTLRHEGLRTVENRESHGNG